MRQNPCGTQERTPPTRWRRAKIYLFVRVICFIFRCFVFLRLFRCRVFLFGWSITGQLTMRLVFHFDRYLVSLLDKYCACGVNYRCSVDITWPCESNSNRKGHGHCGRRWGTSAFHLLLLWHFCGSTIAALVVHDALHYSGVLYVLSNLLQTLHTVPGIISQVHSDTNIIPLYMERGDPVTPLPDIRMSAHFRSLFGELYLRPQIPRPHRRCVHETREQAAFNLECQKHLFLNLLYRFILVC